MMHLRFIIPILLLHCCLRGLAQPVIDCDSLSREPLPEAAQQADAGSLAEPLTHLNGCELDELDYQILEAPMFLAIAQELRQLRPAIGPLTYRDLAIAVRRIKAQEYYQVIRETLAEALRLADKPASLAAWLAGDKEAIVGIGAAPEVVASLEAFLKLYPEPGRTYNQLMLIAYSDRIETATVPVEVPTEPEAQQAADSTLGFKPFAGSLDSLLTQARRLHRPLLLYFSGYGVINARKMEHYVLSDREVRRLVRDSFYAVVLYVDDRAPLATPEVSPVTGRQLRTRGHQASELQEVRFSHNIQPAVYVVDVNSGSSALAFRIYPGHREDREAFLEFLNKSLAEFRH
jgi:hypothetical protein